MIKLLIILLFPFSSFATNYYFDNSGSDLSAGTSPGAAWQTISKANSSMGSFVTGDSLLFKSNGIWNERLNITAVGLKVSSYGAGNKPLITGLATLGGFSDQGGNIWRTTVTLKNLNTVYYNGALVAKGRTPNTGYSTISAHSGSTQISTALTGTPDYTGGEVVIRTTHWIIDKAVITSQAAGVLNFSPATTSAPINGYGYFIQNLPSTLDIAGEWCYDSTTNFFSIYSVGTPTVQAANLDTLIYVNHVRGVTINGLQFNGANQSAIQVNNSNSCSILNCTINNSGTNGIYAMVSDTLTVQYDSVLNSLNDGMYLRYHLDSTATNNQFMTVKNNYIHKAGYLAGMGRSGNQTYSGMILGGDYFLSQYNTIDSIGYNGIVFFGNHSHVRNNVVSNFTFTKNDGGGIYTVTNGKLDCSIAGNIVYNGIGTSAIPGTGSAPFLTVGIYIDNGMSDIRADSNTVYNIGGGYGVGLFINGGSRDTVRYNTLFGADTAALWIAGTGTANVINHNNLVQTVSTASCFEKTNGCCSFGTLDYDYYSRPVREDSIIMIVGASYFARSLPNFVAASGGLESNATGTVLRTTGNPIIYYNTTNSNLIQPLTRIMRDNNGTAYAGSVTISPYSSVILYETTYPYFGYIKTSL